MKKILARFILFLDRLLFPPRVTFESVLADELNKAYECQYKMMIMMEED